MKTLCLLISLVGVALAQTTDPVILQLRRASATATNASTKEIVYIAVKLTTGKPPLPPTYSYSARDFFFAPDGLGPLETMEIVHEEQMNDPSVKAQVMFVQFADGSTWGEPNEYSAVTLKLRKPKFDFCERALAAYRSGGKAALTAQLENATQGFSGYAYSFEDRVKGAVAAEARSMLNLQEQAGTDAVLKKLTHKVEAARARYAAGKF